LEADSRLREPVWYLEKGGKIVDAISSIRADMAIFIHNLLVLGEDVFVSWAEDRLRAPELLQVAIIPSERRDPQCPMEYIVTVNAELERKLAEAEERKG
jgi:hypothetical protein